MNVFKRGMEAKCFTVFPRSSAIIYIIYIYVYIHNSKVFHCFSIIQMQFTFLIDLPLKAFDIWMSLLRWGLHGHLARAVPWTWPGFWCFLHEGSLLLGEYPSVKPVGQIHVIFIFRIFSGVHGFLIPWIAFCQAASLVGRKNSISSCSSIATCGPVLFICGTFTNRQAIV